MALPELESFYLVGGTALALQLGHRFSVDLDLFTTEPFDKEAVFYLLNDTFESVTLESESASMLITNINEVKVDFVKMGYPVLFPPLMKGGVRMLEVRDIAPMKLKAIAQRGSKKDFYDIHFLLELMPLSEMIQLFSEKFKQQEVFHIIKSLNYFEDAAQYADPVVFDKTVTWKKVKSEIQAAVKNMIP